MSVATLVVAFLILSIQTYIVLTKRNEEAIGWFSSVASTLASILIGITVTLFIIEFQENQAVKNSKDRHLKLLSMELSAIKNHLNERDTAKITFNNKDYNILATRIDNTALRTAALSGVFEESEIFMMLDLSNSIDFLNDKTLALMNGLNTSPSNVF